MGREKLRKRCPLHDDLIAEILSYLPAKTFVRLLSVCKTFHQLSFDYHFHLLQSHHNTTISGFLVEYHGTNLSLLKVDPCTGVPKSSLEFLRNSNATILGSAGGLIFVLHGNEGSFKRILYTQFKRITHRLKILNYIIMMSLRETD